MVHVTILGMAMPLHAVELDLVAKRQGGADIFGDSFVTDPLPPDRQLTGHGEVIKTRG